MVDLNKYNEKEIVAAIKVVEEIVDCEDFNLEVNEFAAVDGNGNEINTEHFFNIVDRQEINLGDIESDYFSNLALIIDRMGIYHNDYFYEDYNSRVREGIEVPQDDWARKVLIFFGSNYCQELISAIDVETYQAYKDKELGCLNLNEGEKERYVKDGHFDAVGYLCDKAIAIKIMDTQEAYPMVEYDNRVFVAAHGDWYVSKEEMLKDLKAGENSFCNGYYTYGTLVETELYQVKEDMNDLGLYDLNDKYGFYLSEFELEYIGLSDELKEFKKDFFAVIAEAKARADRSKGNVSNDKSEIDREME